MVVIPTSITKPVAHEGEGREGRKEKDNNQFS